MTRTAENIVRQDVHYCVSSLVHTLAQGCDYTDRANDAGRNLQALAEQAYDLFLGTPDFEEAAVQDDWSVEFNMFVNHRLETVSENASPKDACGWEDLCREFDIEPIEREVFEHWIVSDWLADKLAEKGEKVDKDFAGLTVWARTTTGQAICMDAVLEEIAADLVEA